MLCSVLQVFLVSVEERFHGPECYKLDHHMAELQQRIVDNSY